MISQVSLYFHDKLGRELERRSRMPTIGPINFLWNVRHMHVGFSP
jgi:hypothetical protein